MTTPHTPPPKPFDDDEQPSPSQRADLAHALRIIFQWVCSGNRHDPRYSKHLGRRCVAALWVVSPEYFEGRSLTELANERGIDCTRATLSKESAAFSRLTTLRNGGQKLPSNKRKKTKESFNSQ